MGWTDKSHLRGSGCAQDLIQCSLPDAIWSREEADDDPTGCADFPGYRGALLSISVFCRIRESVFSTCTVSA